MQRIEMTNLDRWVARYLRGQRYQFQLQFGRSREAWQIALDARSPALNLPDAFYDDEWEQVVKPARLRIGRRISPSPALAAARG